jgi:hypothetical protein
MEAYRKSNGRRSEKGRRQKPKGVESNEKDKHGEITKKKRWRRQDEGK